MNKPQDVVRCECSATRGVRCSWMGPVGETVLIGFGPAMGESLADRKTVRVRAECALDLINRNLLPPNASPSIQTAGYVVWQVNGPLLGAGATQEEAKRSFWESYPDAEGETVQAYTRNVASQNVVMIPATAALIGQFHDEGGDVLVHVAYGVAMTMEEREVCLVFDESQHQAFEESGQ